MRRTTRKSRHYSIGLFPSAAATAGISKGSASAIPAIHANVALGGVGLFYGGLFYFNRILVKYKKAKAKKEIMQQKEVIKETADNIRKKNPGISNEQAQKIAYDVLEKNGSRITSKSSLKRKETRIYRL